jgi:hypothetical protein
LDPNRTKYWDADPNDERHWEVKEWFAGDFNSHVVDVD